MIRLLPALACATPALAHDGAHLHPHGIDAVWLFAASAVAVVAAVGVALLWWRR